MRYIYIILSILCAIRYSIANFSVVPIKKAATSPPSPPLPDLTSALPTSSPLPPPLSSILTTKSTSTTKAGAGRIIGGRAAIRGEFPYQVGFRNGKDGKIWCGGSIISTEWVISASHCFCEADKKCPDPFNNITVYAGEVVSIPTSDSFTTYIDDVIIHPDYDAKLYRNDICLIKVRTPFIFDKSNIQPVNLPNKLHTDGYCVASGFGKTEHASNSEILLVTDIPLVDIDKCVERYKDNKYKVIRDIMLCAGHSEQFKDTCQGDSGGPLVCSKSLVGVVSYGFGCANLDTPAIYANVHNYLSWIKLHTGVDAPAAKSGIGTNILCVFLFTTFLFILVVIL